MNLKKICLTVSLVLLTVLILLLPNQCLAYARTGLDLWYQKMIPTLFPFMVLSGILIQMDLTDGMTRILKPILHPLFRVSPSCLYGILVGFLCGFPMGAHAAAQLYRQGRITRQEASYLLSFCNNIGPVYFLGFVLPTLGLSHRKLPFLLGMYALPLLYGLFLRYTVFLPQLPLFSDNTSAKTEAKPSGSFLQAMDTSIQSALLGIARLGGYMIFCNLLFIVPDLLMKLLPGTPLADFLLTGCISCLLEISGGIRLLGNRLPLFILCVLPFGGLSCIAQTYSILRETDLSIGEYVMHKAILMAITVFYYLLLSGLS